jgi:hypothetical protein
MSPRCWAVVLLIATWACGADPSGSDLADIHVGIAMSGADSMSGRGLAVSLDRGPPKALSKLEIRFTDVEGGVHTITLKNLALNCTVAGSNPVSVSATSGQTIEVRFAITCNDPGTLIVTTQTTTTSGARPESYGLMLDGDSAARVAATGQMAIVVGEGNHTAELSGLPASCAVEPGGVDEFSVAAGDTTEIRFQVSCPPPPPPGPSAIALTVTTEGFLGGPISNDGYDVLLDDIVVTHVRSNGTARLTPVDPGSHWLRLAGLTLGCSYAGPQQIVVPDSGSVPARFQVHCWPPGIP